jgi:hypothetical protein
MGSPFSLRSPISVDFTYWQRILCYIDVRAAKKRDDTSSAIKNIADD